MRAPVGSGAAGGHPARVRKSGSGVGRSQTQAHKPPRSRRPDRCGSCSCYSWQMSYDAAGRCMATLGCFGVGKMTLSLP